MDGYGRTLTKAHILVIVLTIITGMYYGLRPLNSWGLLLPILSAIATVVLTPPSIFKNYEWQVRKNLVDILNGTRTRQATKEVDKAFALHGVLRKLGIPLQKPDYGKSVGQVYCEFARVIISWNKSLDVLTEASTSGLPDTPSWFLIVVRVNTAYLRVVWASQKIPAQDIPSLIVVEHLTH